MLMPGLDVSAHKHQCLALTSMPSNLGISINSTEKCLSLASTLNPFSQNGLNVDARLKCQCALISKPVIKFEAIFSKKLKT